MQFTLPHIGTVFPVTFVSALGVGDEVGLQTLLGQSRIGTARQLAFKILFQCLLVTQLVQL